MIAARGERRDTGPTNRRSDRGARRAEGGTGAAFRLQSGSMRTGGQRHPEHQEQSASRAATVRWRASAASASG
jgi:hypothetical protein